MIKVKLSHGAILPERNTKYDSGLDLRARGIKIMEKKHRYNDESEFWFDDTFISEFCIDPGETVLVRTGIQLQLSSPIDCGECYKAIEAQVRSRSGLALKSGIVVLNSPGTVDNEYTGDISVILKNTSDWPFYLRENDKVAQLVFVEVIIPKHLEIIDEINVTDRSDKGFGSSGV